MNARAADFYDAFAQHRFVRDYVAGNLRVTRQLEFFSNAIPLDTERILIIGCGSGESAYYIARRVARRARILGIDISPKAIEFARRVFPHARIEYCLMDVLAEPLNGQWDVILLPDVYEHIPFESRPTFHQMLRIALDEDGRILVTLPSPGQQEYLKSRGEGLQVIDEIVTIQDLTQLSNDVTGTLTYFNFISVWYSNDYIHAGIERNPKSMQALDAVNRSGVRDGLGCSRWNRAFQYLRRRLGWNALIRALRIRRVKRVMESFDI